MNEQDFIKAGYTFVGTINTENKLMSFLKAKSGAFASSYGADRLVR